MEYILNESAYKTTNGFKINNIKLDLDIPEIKDIKLFNDDSIKQEIVNDTFTSKIGLTFNKYLDVNIDMNSDNKIITYEFDKDNNILVSNININVHNQTTNHLYLIFKSLDDSINYNNIKINTNVTNSSLNITVINLLNDNSYSFISYDNKVDKDGLLVNNHIDLGANIKVNNYYSELIGEQSDNMLNTLYIGKDNNKLDYNYHIKNIAPRTTAKINTEGLLKDEAYKQHKGIIDFIEGCSKSKGEELENCVLLSDKAISRSCPMLMCHEEDVEGAHGVSTGKIDKDKLFYLMSRGFNESDAKKMIIISNFNKIIGCMTNEEIKTMLYEYLDEIL